MREKERERRKKEGGEVVTLPVFASMIVAGPGVHDEAVSRGFASMPTRCMRP